VAALLLCITIFFWGTTYRASAIAAEHGPPIMVTAMRCLPAAIALLMAAFLLHSRLPSRALWGWTTVIGVLGVALTIEGISESSARAGAANAAVLLNTSPFWVLILERIIFKESISTVRVLGLTLGFAGIVIMVSSQLGSIPDTGNFILGMMMALIAALAWGIAIVLMKVLFVRHPQIEMIGFMAAQYIVASAVLLPLAFGLEGTSTTDWSSTGFWGPVLWLAICSSAIANTSFVSAVRILSPTTAASWLFMAPVVAVVVDVIYGKPPSTVVLVGMGIAIAGVAIVNGAPTLRKRRLETGSARA